MKTFNGIVLGGCLVLSALERNWPAVGGWAAALAWFLVAMSYRSKP